MLVSAPILAVLALAETANAAFFWYPEYRCVEDHTCIASKRAESEDAVNDGLTMRLAQRPRKVYSFILEINA